MSDDYCYVPIDIEPPVDNLRARIKALEDRLDRIERTNKALIDYIDVLRACQPPPAIPYPVPVPYPVPASPPCQPVPPVPYIQPYVPHVDYPRIICRPSTTASTSIGANA